MDLFNGGMKNIWPKRVYVDLFAGPGMCKDRMTKDEFDGSALRALACAPSFTDLFLNDIDPRYIDALQQRQQRRYPSARVSYFSLDCNVAAHRIAKELSSGALTLVFVDPWTYEISFDALVALAERPSTDLIVTFHSWAIMRNARVEVANVDRFLGDHSWRDRYWPAMGDPSNPPTTVLIETFRTNLASRLGYRFFGDPQVIRNTTGRPIHYLLFASRHPRGLDFWEKSSKRMRSGQRTLPFL